ncbi:Por secretion system C-terminal sorting domain-containing protein [Dyadobacter soli]|uniref:Por secretion system C-terminal sorting domain-containing protein n=1 Tax=Dyadobacter soli TaxID=659014 RepID=A0A1G7ZWX9_9BACT|nr:T9SS type A sorting domain-containing protein [Dyadobacter soli]SDH13174.1 Por secretion system C-terminal sorting domain-containing protein [Dyadobacter soli]
MRKGRILFVLLAVFGPLRILGQVLPLGQWQSHFSYRSARQVVDAGSRVYCASYNGLFSVNTENGETRALSKADGLSNTGIGAMGYLPSSKLLMLAYRSGTIDFVYLNERSEPDQIETWDLLNDTQGLPADKAIRRIVFRENLAYIATGFGVLVLDTQLRQVEETYRYIGPNGAQVAVSDLAFSEDSLFVITNQGLLTTSMHDGVNRQYFGNWKAVTSPGSISSIAFFSGAVHAAVPGKGILKYEKGAWKIVYNSSASGLRILDAGDLLTITMGNTILALDPRYVAQTFNSPLFGNVASGIRKGSNAFWLADQKNGLVTNQFSDFKSVSPAQADTTISPRADSTITDLNGLSWTRLPETSGAGILVSNADGSRKKVLSTSVGTGTLPASKINSLALDQDGYVWFASAKGVGYFIPDGVLEATRVDAILPIYGQRRLFNNEECTAIAVEPGNRKWVGTRTGLYLFNADGTELVRKFTSADSPLPLDVIRALRFEAETGLLFVDTPAGMVSYQSDAKGASESITRITIFPNPIRPGYSGNVGISGLTGQSTVKITDLAGRLVYEAHSEGGLASWNLNDYTGRRVRAGIYIVFVVSADGAEQQAGKLAIIN